MTLARLRQMSSEELSWRGTAAARSAAGRLGVTLRAPRWNRGDITRVLSGSAFDGDLRRAIVRHQWTEVDRRLTATLCARPSRFPLDPASEADLRGAVLARWPEAAPAAAHRADRIVTGHYDVLGYRGLSYAPNGEIDWHLDPVHNRRAPRRFWADVPYLDPETGDHKIIWEVNRHQHWLALGRALWLTGDGRYAQHMVRELESWLAANPPLVGINWASMLEIGFRAISWTWGLHFLLGARHAGPGDGWLVDLLVGLDRQLTHVEENLSYYFSPNTHLTGEALALYVVGLALPEMAASARWVDTGRRILLTEIDRQIHADGGHAERSTHYQRYTLDFYLCALLAAERAHDDSAIAPFRDAASRLATFTRGMADDRGLLPLIGDDDGGMLWPIAGRECPDVRDSLGLAAIVLDRPDLAAWGVPEEVFWVAGRDAIERAPGIEASPRATAIPSCACPDTGYLVFRGDEGSHAVFDAGAHGYMNGGHAHADALALTLTLAGRPLLIDPGTSTYTMDPRLRDSLRSSRSHNTVTIDDRSSATPAGPFHWQTRADARLDAWRSNPAFDWAEGSHDGYGTARHRRTVLRTADDGWLVVDDVLGEGRHTASAHWHFDPAWMLSCDAPGRVRARHFDGDAAWLLYDAADVWLVHGDEDSRLGWYAPTYGTLVPTWTARTACEGSAPLSMLTWIGGAGEAPVLERLTPVCDAGGRVAAARVARGRRTSVFLVRPGEPSSRETRGCEILAYQTNARLLHYAEDAGSLAVLDLADATHALALRDGWLGVSADAPMPDLHVAIGPGTIDLRTSAPPPSLRLEGAAVDGVRALRLNGREHVPVPDVRRDTIRIAAADWAAAHPSPSPAYS